jgi:hypothetical protein
MAAAADDGRWARALEPGGEKRVAGRAVGEVLGVPVPFIGSEAVGAGARPAAVNGAVSSGGGNGEGKRGVEEMKGAVVPIHFATGGEGCYVGKVSRRQRHSARRRWLGLWLKEGEE